MRSSTVEWTRSHVRLLVEMYQERPCLWKLSDALYANRKAKAKAYAEIVAAFRDTCPQADETFLKTKFQNMRCTYRREMKKVEESERGGKGGNVYRPALWYYDLLAFTKDQESPFLSANDSSQTGAEGNEGVFEQFQVPPDAQVRREKEKVKAQDKPCFREPPRAAKRSGAGAAEDEAPAVPRACGCAQSKASTGDDCGALGTYVAEKLRKMDDTQQILVEALIQKVITRGLQKRLTDDTDLAEVISPQLIISEVK